MATDAWPAGRRGSLILLGASLAWLAWMLWSAQASILGAAEPVTAIIVAASALPVVIAATMLAGGAAGLAALALRPLVSRLRWAPTTGAAAGVLLLLTERTTGIGGLQIFGIVGRLSPADPTYLDYVAQSRLDYAMIVLFVGAIVALLCLGATMRRPESESATSR